MSAYFLVDVGRVVQVQARSAKEAAYLALLSYPKPANGKLIVQERDGEDSDASVQTFVVAGRTCRTCGCTEERACRGGCCWVEWDLCSACRVQ